MGQIFLFTGENRFTLLAERARWISAFAEKHGVENLLRLDAKDASFPQLATDLSTAPFIAESRMIMVEGIPAFSKEQMASIPSILHPQVVLVFVDAKPDKRFAGVKELLSLAETRTFPVLNAPKLRAWMDRYAKERDAVLESSAREMLFMLVGEDQEMLAREIEKLSSAEGGIITPAWVERLTIPSAERTVWPLIEFLAEGNQRDALRYARELLERGENAHGVWNILGWMLTSLVSVSLATEEGMKNPVQIAKATGVNFVTVRSLLHLSETIGKDGLKRIVDFFVRSDIGLKTGRYRATNDASEELEALIDTCILSFRGGRAAV